MGNAVRIEVRGAEQSELEAHPFSGVIQHAFDGLVGVNPSRVEDLVAALDGATLVLLVSDKWECHYDTATQEVVLSTCVVESMWAAAYAYYLLYKPVEGSHGGDHTGALTGERLAPALEVFRWALQRARKGGEPWPESFPKPPDPDKQDLSSDLSPEGVASEMTLVCIAALLLHEIGHHTLEHHPGAEQSDAIQMERDADNFAVDWLLSGKEDNEKAKEKMRLGVAMAFGWMVARETIAWKSDRLVGMDDKDRSGRKKRVHPWSYSRFFDLLGRAEGEDHATTWCVAVAILALHVSHVGLEVPRGPFETCRVAADALVDLLASRVQ